MKHTFMGTEGLPGAVIYSKQISYGDNGVHMLLVIIQLWRWWIHKVLYSSRVSYSWRWNGICRLENFSIIAWQVKLVDFEVTQQMVSSTHHRFCFKDGTLTTEQVRRCCKTLPCHNILHHLSDAIVHNEAHERRWAVTFERYSGRRIRTDSTMGLGLDNDTKVEVEEEIEELFPNPNLSKKNFTLKKILRWWMDLTNSNLNPTYWTIEMSAIDEI